MCQKQRATRAQRDTLGRDKAHRGVCGGRPRNIMPKRRGERSPRALACQRFGERRTRASEGFTVRVRRRTEPRLELSRLGGIEPELVSAAVLRPSVRGWELE